MRYSMGDNVQFRYNKSFTYSTAILLTILLSFLAFRTFQLGGADLLIMLSFDGFFALLILFIIVKYLVPAIKGKTALELNERSIIDLIRHRVINWDNVCSVRLITLYGVFTPGIAIDLVDKKIFFQEKKSFQRLIAKVIDLSYKTPCVIPLQYISGDIKEIFSAVDLYFSRSKNSA